MPGGGPGGQICARVHRCAAHARPAWPEDREGEARSRTRAAAGEVLQPGAAALGRPSQRRREVPRERRAAARSATTSTSPRSPPSSAHRATKLRATGPNSQAVRAIACCGEAPTLALARRASCGRRPERGGRVALDVAASRLRAGEDVVGRDVRRGWRRPRPRGARLPAPAALTRERPVGSVSPPSTSVQAAQLRTAAGSARRPPAPPRRGRPRRARPGQGRDLVASRARAGADQPPRRASRRRPRGAASQDRDVGVVADQETNTPGACSRPARTVTLRPSSEDSMRPSSSLDRCSRRAGSNARPRRG